MAKKRSGGCYEDKKQLNTLSAKKVAQWRKILVNFGQPSD